MDIVLKTVYTLLSVQHTPQLPGSKTKSLPRLLQPLRSLTPAPERATPGKEAAMICTLRGQKRGACIGPPGARLRCCMEAQRAVAWREGGGAFLELEVLV